MNTLSATIDNSIANGISFLSRHQLHHGEFINYVSNREDITGSCSTVSITYNTSLICYSLSFLSDYPESEKMIAKSIHFLNAHRQYGVWNFLSKTGVMYPLLPFDVDSTSLAAWVLRERNLNPEGDRIATKIILANRNRKGLFYTWIVPRLSSAYSLRFLRIAVHVLFNPIRHVVYWYHTNCNYFDVDAGINANVLFYLGDIPATQPVVDLLVNIIQDNKEATCDKWYNNPFVIYYFFSRNYCHGIHKLEAIWPPIIDRILSLAYNDGRLGSTLLDTALAVCTLLNLHHSSVVLDKAVQYIIHAQQEYGNWERWSHYTAGDEHAHFGSEEITTAFCLEALVRYRKK